MKLKKQNDIIEQALKEDCAFADITTNALIPKNKICKAYIVVKEDAVIYGLNIVKNVFTRLDSKVQLTFRCSDGQRVKKGKKIVFIKGKARALLSAERVALNFLGMLSGIATLTHQFVKKVYPFKVKIMDTRKTTPGLRSLEKMAVRCAGGVNHRADLGEMVLIKDNHRLLCQGDALLKLIDHIKKSTKKIVEVEVDNLKQFKTILKAAPDIILLDNMRAAEMKEAVNLNNLLKLKKGQNRIVIETSGRINLNNIRQIARTGVDRISIGALTNSRRSIDFSMEFIQS